MLGNSSALARRADPAGPFRHARSHCFTRDGDSWRNSINFPRIPFTAFIPVNLRGIFRVPCGREGDLCRNTMPAGLDRPSVVVFFPIFGIMISISCRLAIAAVALMASPGELGRRAMARFSVSRATLTRHSCRETRHPGASDASPEASEASVSGVKLQKTNPSDPTVDIHATPKRRETNPRGRS